MREVTRTALQGDTEEQWPSSDQIAKADAKIDERLAHLLQFECGECL